MNFKFFQKIALLLLIRFAFIFGIVITTFSIVYNLMLVSQMLTLIAAVFIFLVQWFIVNMMMKDVAKWLLTDDERKIGGL